MIFTCLSTEPMTLISKVKCCLFNSYLLNSLQFGLITVHCLGMEVLSNLKYRIHLSRQWNCWSRRCIWSITCRHCSNYIFILDSTPGFNESGKDNFKTRWKTFMFWDSMRLILAVWQYFLSTVSVWIKTYVVDKYIYLSDRMLYLSGFWCWDIISDLLKCHITILLHVERMHQVCVYNSI